MRALLLGVILSLVSLVSHAGLLRGDSQTLVLQTPAIFNSSTSNEWRQLESYIDYTTKPKIVIYVAGYGGRQDMGEDFNWSVDRAKNRGIHVKFIVLGPSYSMHALIVCHASTYKMQSFLMFHIGAFNGVPDRSASGKADAARLMQGCVDLGILNLKDVAAVQSGKEVWVYPNGTKVYKQDRR